jgi:hypothetical protein
MDRLLVRCLSHVLNGAEHLGVIPAGREFRFARLAGPVPVSASGCIAVENVDGAFRRKDDLIQRRPIRCGYAIPAGTFGSSIGFRDRIAGPVGFADGLSERVIVLGAVFHRLR